MKRSNWRQNKQRSWSINFDHFAINFFSFDFQLNQKSDFEHLIRKFEISFLIYLILRRLYTHKSLKPKLIVIQNQNNFSNRLSCIYTLHTCIYVFMLIPSGFTFSSSLLFQLIYLLKTFRHLRCNQVLKMERKKSYFCG